MTQEMEVDPHPSVVQDLDGEVKNDVAIFFHYDC